MSLYHHVKDLVSTEIGHWNRKDVVDKIDKVCNKLVKTSELRRILLSAKDNILSDNLGDAKQKFEHVNNMDKLEQIVKNEEKHFNVKKTLVAVMIALGVYAGNANANTTDFARDVINVHTDNGDVVAYTQNNYAYDQENKLIGRVQDGRIVRCDNINSDLSKRINYYAPNFKVVYSATPYAAPINNDSQKQPQHIDEKITDVNDYLRRAGDELGRGNVQISGQMYGKIIEKEKSKSLKINKSQLKNAYIGLAQSYVKLNKIDLALVNYRIVQKYFSKDPVIDGMIKYLEKK